MRYVSTGDNACPIEKNPNIMEIYNATTEYICTLEYLPKNLCLLPKSDGYTSLATIYKGW